MRDQQIDAYRGLIMMYIVCVVHVIHVLHVYRNTMSSLILFEMPVIFFIAGAAMQYARPKDQWGLVKSRVVRVLVPYVLYAFLSILIFVYLGAARGTHFYMDGYGWSEWLSVLTLESLPGVPFAWQVWFVLPYFLISISFNVQKKWLEQVPLGVYLLILTVLVVVCNYIYHTYWDGYLMWILQEVFFYDIFFLIGYKLYRQAWTWWKYLVIALATICFVGYCALRGVPDMQDYKFPPTELFLVYGVMTLGLLSLVFTKVKIPYNRVVDFWNKRGFNLYLYQNVVYFVYWRFAFDRVQEMVGNQLAVFVISSVVIFIGSMLLSLITYPVERKVCDMVR